MITRNNSEGKAYIILLFAILIIVTSGIALFIMGVLPIDQESSKIITGVARSEGLLDFANEESTELPTEEMIVADTAPAPPTPAALSEIDNDWNYYESALGFAIIVPKETFHTYGKCEWKKEGNNYSYRPQQDYIPVVVFEELGEEKAYISVEYYYELGGETEIEGRVYYSECNQVENTLSRLKDEENTYPDGWEIAVSVASNEQELVRFIRSRYGSGCSIGEKKVSSQETTFDVTIKGDGKDIAESACPLNYETVVKYNPTLKRVAAWDLGQAYSFVGDKDYRNIYDEDMVDSFEFK